ncbi:MAG TPA: hypothetical protein C5S50_02845 [Methanosarcinaceae archaeon]|nr:hypothetical protein [Methanosarcinaceae archaeon]
MPLPDVCPLDGKSVCKTSACHLYHVDWRSGEENCSIGYSVTSRKSSKSDPLQDTYAQNTSMRLGRDIPSTAQTRQPVRNEMETDSNKTISPTPEQNVIGEVVRSDKNTTLIESNPALGEMGIKSGDVPKPKKKGKSIDDVMKLDLPDDYEKEFWS